MKTIIAFLAIIAVIGCSGENTSAPITKTTPPPQAAVAATPVAAPVAVPAAKTFTEDEVNRLIADAIAKVKEELSKQQAKEELESAEKSLKDAREDAATAERKRLEAASHYRWDKIRFGSTKDIEGEKSILMEIKRKRDSGEDLTMQECLVAASYWEFKDFADEQQQKYTREEEEKKQRQE